jgi:HTH-type transcriptional regulator/antitoxin HigA
MIWLVFVSGSRNTKAISWVASRRSQNRSEKLSEDNELLNEIGDNEKHPLYGLLDTLGTLIEIYEEEHYPIPDATGAEALRFLMEEHGLTQSDLPEVGSQGVVSEILNGKRELNIRQVRFLAKKFKVSSAVFL